ncbi:hypothetical protein IA57_09825 [Mangrovimonas yunxiaonensis]|uniref:Glycosyl transferase family 2 n=1 Tax=Mangrovimonas yunxiaonensis TaxID=1197477 RepID=A0A084TJ57_9FLAO|nr:glycosyltransferase family 2 protein [Mangrovimonas yunxiaonensis]KFB00743.1 hypothetical protein IA57_09825 [Mangrovimonas yunxiaonensis]GGH45970.1 hypothetical protein GCM10011364_19800 [Mangrovimonas yunxiaonensis]
MTAAIVMTVKNEARLLRSNILYHLGIGVKKVFVYFDGTTDNGRSTIIDLDHVVCTNSVSVTSMQQYDFLAPFLTKAKLHHTARQCLNTYHALLQCKQEGIDWLVSLDADELLLTPELGNQTLQSFLKSASSLDLDVVKLQPMEVVNRQMHYNNVIIEETLFKRQKNFTSKWDQIYRRFYNPYTTSYEKKSYWLGHTMGKAMIRVAAGIMPKTVHRYQKIDGAKLQIKTMGHVLHYHVYDAEDFIKKYKNFKHRPDTFLSGHKIEDLKQLWITLVNDSKYSQEDLEYYYKTNVLFDTKAEKRLYRTRVFNVLKRKESAVVQITHPKTILEEQLKHDRL